MKTQTTFSSPLHVIGRDPYLTIEVLKAIGQRSNKKSSWFAIRILKNLWKAFLPISQKNYRRA
jgi:hypothetical protein